MSDIEATVEKYVASWEEPNAELRRQVISELWAEDAIYKNPFVEFRGRDGVEAAVTQAYDLFVTKGYTFKVVKLDTSQDAVRYTWEMTLPGASEPEAVGTQVVVLDENGRMANDHQFIDKAPTGMEELVHVGLDV
ncbi:nuclear transport factor 2 family protein [Streptomyces sp. NPDC050485]|uniref:nuclear transport factor 2 family protein n=1 Tax=Streptomyces sp. NPDC050485 TaxID=3365617 RepID=UPI0037A3433B